MQNSAFIQKKQLKLEIYSRISYSGDVQSVKNKFVLDDPKNLFRMLKNKYKEYYVYNLKDKNNLDYVVLMIKQKFDT